jgi:hypothetical protein
VVLPISKKQPQRLVEIPSSYKILIIWTRLMAGKIFLNYRRADDAGFAHALQLRLEAAFPPGDLFMDVQGNIKPGDDLFEILNEQVANSDVVLVVIGPRWVESLAAHRDDLDDFVVLEISIALEQRKRTIPVLVGNASMPKAESLPEAIRRLARLNAVGLSPDRFKADSQGLITAIKDHLSAAEAERAARSELERRAAEAERLNAEARAEERVIAAEKHGREQAAAGLSAAQIQKAEELANWDFVKGRNSIQDLRDHLARFPQGNTYRYALDQLDQLVWAEFGGKFRLKDLRAYVDEFPAGSNVKSAKAQITEMEQQRGGSRCGRALASGGGGGLE